MSATEWIQEWLREFPYTESLVLMERQRGKTDEDIKDFLEGL